uniref:Uncharacterized protein n=1 Tax=Rhizophora mucronata TaxID=61149 RepID=A0A2P2JHV4_RHIMU
MTNYNLLNLAHEGPIFCRSFPAPRSETDDTASLHQQYI